MIEQIASLTASSYVRGAGAAPEIAATSSDVKWPDLSREEKRSLLGTKVDWSGFDDRHRTITEDNVLAGADQVCWMKPFYTPYEDFAFPLTEGENAQYLEDIADSYGISVDQLDDYYEKQAGELADPVESDDYDSVLDKSAGRGKYRSSDRDSDLER
ncbi:hypothetical protein [Singulisphaera sp. PoT]|uniref:hypothetical protein n=1 Tax=Singulisphaera sp. PoT TaxID=3411797 RepID=UPI003BF4FF9B